MTISDEDRTCGWEVFNRVDMHVMQQDAEPLTPEDVARQLMAITADLAKRHQWQQTGHIQGTNPAGVAWPVHEPDSNSVGVHMDEINSVFHPNRSAPLGQYVRRFAQQSETRATKPTPSSKNTARLKDALELASGPATTKVLQDIYSDGYTASTDSDPDSSVRLSALLAEAANFAGNLVAYMAGDGVPDPSDKADQLASDCATSGGTAGTKDDIESNGGTQYRLIPEANACEDCTSAAGVHDLDDDDNSPPIHQSCGCEIEAVA